MSAPAVVMDDVTKRFARGEYHDTLRDLLGRLVTLGRRGPRREWFNAVDHVSFEVDRGEALGIIGPNSQLAALLVTNIHAIESPKIPSPATTWTQVNAPAVEDCRSAPLHGFDVGVPDAPPE